jgi:outer membrane lipoprotein-sorting protein
MMIPAALPALAADDLNKVLAKLDEASIKFKSAAADIDWDNVQTQPILDKDTQAGTVLFERKNGQLSMALHLKTDNGKPVPKDMVYAGGQFKLYEPLLKQIQVFQAGANRADYDTFLTLGFGGSGKDLVKNWQATYAGSETVDGANTDKLELLPIQDSVKKNITKVILWVNMDNGIAVKQRSIDPAGNYREVTYHNVHLNAPVPSKAFEIKTASGTRVVNH